MNNEPLPLSRYNAAEVLELQKLVFKEINRYRDAATKLPAPSAVTEAHTVKYVMRQLNLKVVGNYKKEARRASTAADMSSFNEATKDEDYIPESVDP